MSWFKKTQIDKNQDILNHSVNLAGIMYKMLKEIQKHFDNLSDKVISSNDYNQIINNQIINNQIINNQIINNQIINNQIINKEKEKILPKIEKMIYDYNKLHELGWSKAVINSMTNDVFYCDGNNFKEIVDTIHHTLTGSWPNKMAKKASMNIHDMSVNLAGILYTLLREFQKEYNKQHDVKLIENYKEPIKNILNNFSKTHNLDWSDYVLEKLSTECIVADGTNFIDIIASIENYLTYNLKKTSQINNKDTAVNLAGVLYSTLRQFQKEWGESYTKVDYSKYRAKVKELITEFSKIHELQWSNYAIDQLTQNCMYSQGDNFVSIIQNLLYGFNSLKINLKKNAQQEENNQIAVELCAILYGINKKFTKEFVNSASFNSHSIIVKYGELIYNAILRFKQDKNLDINEETCKDISRAIIAMGGHDWDDMLDRIAWYLDTFSGNAT